MKKLLIVANPSKISFSHAMAESYRKKAEKQGDEYKVLDLYDINQSYLRYESFDALKKGNIKDIDTIKKIQKDIAWSDEMSFFFPIWWGGIPAILKTFFDSNFSAGFAFNFVAGKSTPEKLLTDKTAKIFCNCDAPGIIYKLSFILGVGLKKYLRSAILGFCGVKMTEFHLYDKLRSRTDENRKKILAKIEQ